MNDTLANEIERLKKDLDAVILAHNYQLPEVQDLADFTGDSLELARKAANIDNRTIVFCGVYFMAETAKILNPGKTVLIPDREAGCPLANFATAAQVREWRAKYPGHAFLAYVNTHAEVKAEVDVCCTSSNALKIVESLDADRIVFLPDRNLGGYVQERTDKEVVLWPGYCPIHETVTPKTVGDARAKYPDALVMAHPECNKAVRELADEVCSTGQMFGVVEKHADRKRFLVVTEWGMNYALKRRFPDREFVEPLRQMECPNMKKITPEKLMAALRSGGVDDRFEVAVDPQVAEKAARSIVKMLSL
jgi:quinolinate synthase